MGTFTKAPRSGARSRLNAQENSQENSQESSRAYSVEGSRQPSAKPAFTPGSTTVSSFLGGLALFGASQAFALGLGEIEPRSALNERFDAEIELLDTRGLQPTEIIASLASTDDFRRVGVERFFFLTSLDFDVTRNARGNLVIRTTSEQPITEPYLNFLVEVLWPNGRLLKEYTVLLDPPTFTTRAPAPVASPERTEVASSTAGRITRDEAPAVAAPRPAERPSAPRASTRLDASSWNVSQRDTAWSIAEATAYQGVSIQQSIIAIQRLNPDAFINDNVNLLKSGVVLRLPTEREARQMDEPTARAEFLAQTEQWRSGNTIASRPTPVREAELPPIAQTTPVPEPTTRSQIDATTAQPIAEAPAASSDQGRLRIVATDETVLDDALLDPTSGVAEEAAAGLAAAEGQLQDLARQVDELNYQLDAQAREVEQQVAERDNQISVRDRQIAQLQEQLKAAREALQNQPAPSATSAEPVPFWQRPSVLGGALGAMAIALAAVLFRRRREDDAEHIDIDELDDESEFSIAAVPEQETAEPLHEPIADPIEEDLNAVADDVDDLDDIDGPVETAMPAGDSESQQTGDVVGEADIYIAYGRYPQAISLLLGALDSNPQQHDVRMRLLEVYGETKDPEGFRQQLALLQEHCDDQPTIDSALELQDSLGDDFAGGGIAAGLAAAAGGVAASVADSVNDAAEVVEDAVEDLQDDTTFDFEPLTQEMATTEMAPVADDADALEAALEDEAAELTDDTLESLAEDNTFEFELPEAEADADDAAEAVADAAGDEFSMDLPIETAELRRVVEDTDDDELLDEIERSLDELESDGLLTDEVDDDEFAFDDDADTSATKLDLARAYIDMGDDDGAREILGEVLSEGDTAQQQEANELLAKL